MELREDWKDQTGNYFVRLVQIDTRILAIEGVLDINGTTIEGVAANYELTVNQVPSLVAVNLS